MRVHEVVSATEIGLEAEIRGALASCAPDVVLQLRVSAAQAGAAALRAARLRAVAPPTANVTVAVPGRPRFRVASPARGPGLGCEV